MTTLHDLEIALVNADRAGDAESATRLAKAISYYRKDKANLIPNTPLKFEDKEEPGLVEKAIGAGEAGITALTGMTSGLIGTVAGGVGQIARNVIGGKFGTKEGATDVNRAAAATGSSLTYEPRTESGKENVRGLAKLAAGIPLIPGMGPGIPGAISSSAKAVAPIAVGTAVGGSRLAEIAAKGAATQVGDKMAVIKEMATGKPAKKPTYQSVEPGSTGAAATPDELRRLATMEGLPYKMEPTRAAITGNPADKQLEALYIKHPELGESLRANAERNNKLILQNMDAFIEDTGANVVAKPLLGSVLSKELFQGYEIAKKRTTEAFQKAKESPEAQIIVDISPLGDYLNKSTTGVPASAMQDSTRQILIKNGWATKNDDGTITINPMTNATAEELRAAVNANTNWNVPTDVKFRGDLVRLIDASTAPSSGELFKKARLLRTRQANKYENRAIVADLITRRGEDRKIPLENVFDRTIIGGSKEDVTFLRRVLKTHGETGQKTWNDIKATTLNHLREAATKNRPEYASGEKVVSGSGYSQALKQLDKSGKLDLIFDHRTAQQLRDIDSILTYIQTAPPDTLINTSGTALTTAMLLGESGASFAATGIPAPVVSTLKLIKAKAKDNKIRAEIQRAIEYRKNMR